MISSRFIKHSFIYTVAGSLPMASAILLMPFYGHFLSAEVFGLLSVYFTISLLVQILVTYSFDASIYIFYHEHKGNPAQLARFISSVFIFILGVSIAVSLILSATGWWLFSFIFNEQDISFYPFGILSVTTGVLQAVFKVNNSLLQTSEKATLFLKTNLFSFSLIAFLTIGGLYFFPNSLWGPIGGKMIGAFISFTWILSRIIKNYGYAFDWKLIQQTFSFNHPSLIYQIQQWFINYYDRIIILMLLSKATVGYYDLAAKCLLAIDFLLTGLNASFYPKVLSIVHAQQSKSSTIEINRYYHGLTAVSMLAVVASIIIFPVAIKLFFPVSYFDAINLIPLLALVYLLRPFRMYLAMPFAALKYSKPFPYYYLFLALLKISLMYLLVPQWGVIAIVFSTLVIYSIEIMLLYIGIKNKFLIKINFFKLIYAPVILLILIICGEIFLRTNMSFKVIVHSIYLLIAAGILLFFYRNELKNQLLKFK